MTDDKQLTDALLIVLLIAFSTGLLIGLIIGWTT